MWRKISSLSSLQPNTHFQVRSGILDIFPFVSDLIFPEESFKMEGVEIAAWDLLHIVDKVGSYQIFIVIVVPLRKHNVPVVMPQQTVLQRSLGTTILEPLVCSANTTRLTFKREPHHTLRQRDIGVNTASKLHRRAIFGSFLSIFDLCSRLWNVAQFLVAATFLHSLFPGKVPGCTTITKSLVMWLDRCELTRFIRLK